MGSQHLAALAAVAAACVATGIAARRLSPAGRRWLGSFLAVLTLGYVAFTYGSLLRLGLLRADDGLPLQLCHIVLFLCAISVLAPRPLLFELIYFFGLAGGGQALLTPDVASGFPSWEFVAFFWSHGLVLVTLVFLATAYHLRPRPGGVGRAMLWLNVYVVTIGALDAATGWNYGYLCHKPAQASLLDYFGPWPWYILSMEAFALLTFGILAQVWRAVDRTPAPR